MDPLMDRGQHTTNNLKVAQDIIEFKISLLSKIPGFFFIPSASRSFEDQLTRRAGVGIGGHPGLGPQILAASLEPENDQLHGLSRQGRTGTTGTKGLQKKTAIDM